MHHGKTQIYLVVYVDDILLTDNDPKAISELLQKLHSRFTMKNLGLANHFLGIKITSTTDKYHLSQSSYASSILQLANLTHCNHLANPSCTKITSPTVEDQPCFNQGTYRQLIGSLQYLMLTRPDITFTVNMLSQHMHDPAAIHAYMLKRLLHYIKGKIDLGIPITRSTLILRTFSDADWVADPISRKSIFGFCTFLGDTLVSWTVKKQTTVFRSSTKSEYRALTAAMANTIWIKRLLSNFSVQHGTPIDISCDNVATLSEKKYDTKIEEISTLSDFQSRIQQYMVISDKLLINFDVFGACVKDMIVGQCDNRGVVAEHIGGNLLQEAKIG
ncbi:uncharacterized protein LOC114579442 [Dendrobium catenatum]|uniref:uncharacterized protein LOC114579442 n=1 Tax=Dendrobium catenatum TaxID=906689 RepID=UPI0010A0424C|nr:uncharacterized protein LOC114579442 [Dendrobium catenatum]